MRGESENSSEDDFCQTFCRGGTDTDPVAIVILFIDLIFNRQFEKTKFLLALILNIIFFIFIMYTLHHALDN